MGLVISVPCLWKYTNRNPNSPAPKCAKSVAGFIFGISAMLTMANAMAGYLAGINPIR